jgi:hypothetical protein
MDFYVVDGEPYTDAWYEWYRNFAMYYDEYYDEFVVNSGDVIVVSVSVRARATYADEVQMGWRMLRSRSWYKMR